MKWGVVDKGHEMRKWLPHAAEIVVTPWRCNGGCFLVRYVGAVDRGRARKPSSSVNGKAFLYMEVWGPWDS